MSKTYFKATRTDGTDFYTGTVDYAGKNGGGRVKVPSQATLRHDDKGRREYFCCTPGVLHASDVPTETLIGGSWPCRLFEVSGRPVAQEGHKYGFRSLKVVREVPPHLVFGPHGKEVVALIERASRLTHGEAVSLRAARGAARDAARGAARGAAWDAAGGAARGAAWDAARGAARDAARGAAWDAALGLVVRDLISTEHYDILTGPWRKVVGRIHADDADL